MAVALAWRAAVLVALKVGPSLEPLVRYVSSHDPTKPFTYGRDLARMLADPKVSDEELSALATAQNGYGVTVATYTGDFEVRRTQIEFSVSGLNVVDEDVRVITFHNVKLVGGLPSSDWTSEDFNALWAGINTWWVSLLPWYSTGISLTRFAVYKEGPNLVPPQPPVFSLDPTLTGTNPNPSLPPQVALTVTEVAGVKKGWGRFYMPNPCTNGTAAVGNVAVCTTAGRPATPFMQAIRDATLAMYNSAHGVFLPYVVYRPHLLPDRLDSSGQPLPDRPANAQAVEKLQIDDIWDVMRSRRWERPMLRLQSAEVGAAGMTLLPAEQEQEPENPGEQAEQEEGSV